MPTDLIKYPDHYHWANRLTHYFSMHQSIKGAFRVGDWLEFMHSDDIAELARHFDKFNEGGSTLHQDLVLLSSLIFARETGHIVPSAESRLTTQLLKQLSAMVHLESLRRDGLLFLEQRLSIRPDFSPDITITAQGRAFLDKYGELPAGGLGAKFV